MFSIISKDEVLCTIILILYPDLPVFPISAARWHKKQARGQDGQRKSKPDRIFGLGRLWMCVIRPGMPVYKFASPYWMQTYPNSFNTFRNIGLWEVCMDNYMHHKDDSQEIYSGCWWVFNRDKKYWKLREWLLPRK